MNYRSFADLSEDTTALARSLSKDYDLVVGIPRSGLLTASLLCLQLNIRMTDVQGLRDRRLLSSGYRYEGKIDGFDDIERVLVVDDSVATGRQMEETKAELAAMDLPFDLEFAAIYVSRTGHRHVDHYVEVVLKPRAFEWNLMHHPILKHTCMNIDGVLCRTPTDEENDDGERYREFLRTVEPAVVPTERVRWLVTNRLEKYRDETEEWLERHGVRYDELVMSDHPSMAARQEANDEAEFKAEVYRNVDAELFIESSPSQSTDIAKLSNKPVFSYGSNELVEPGTIAGSYQRSRTFASRFRQRPLEFSRTAVRYAVELCSGAVERRLGSERDGKSDL